MDRTTVRTLNRVNREFYDRHAAEFAATRRAPWPGWERVLAAYGEGMGSGPKGHPEAILDLGCGNGRLAAFLAGRLDGHRYLGLDSSPALLAEAGARRDLLPETAFVAAELVEQELPFKLASGGGFGWVAAFGLFHHVPGAGTRFRLIREMARQVAPGGLLSVSFWQFADRPRFRKRILDWENVDPGQLDGSDFLLRWGDRDARRYCHHVDDHEAAALAAVSGLEEEASFRADGGLNRYYLLRRPPGAS